MIYGYHSAEKLLVAVGMVEVDLEPAGIVNVFGKYLKVHRFQYLDFRSVWEESIDLHLQ